MAIDLCTLATLPEGTITQRVRHFSSTKLRTQSNNSLDIVVSGAGCNVCLQGIAIATYPAESEANIPLCLVKRTLRKPSSDTSSPTARFHQQVHHRDRPPANSNPDNLVTLCTGCHLYYHQRQTGNISPGQLSLSLEIESQNLTRSVFQPQLSLAIAIADDGSYDLHHNNFALISNVNINMQLSLLID